MVKSSFLIQTRSWFILLPFMIENRYVFQSRLWYVLTVSDDNGREFAKHKKVTTVVETEVHFAHPHKIWEREVIIKIQMDSFVSMIRKRKIKDK